MKGVTRKICPRLIVLVEKSGHPNDGRRFRPALIDLVPKLPASMGQVVREQGRSQASGRGGPGSHERRSDSKSIGDGQDFNHVIARTLNRRTGFTLLQIVHPGDQYEMIGIQEDEISSGTCENLGTGLSGDPQIEDRPSGNVRGSKARGSRISENHHQWAVDRSGEAPMNGQSRDIRSKAGFDPEPLTKFQSQQDGSGKQAQDDEQS